MSRWRGVGSLDACTPCVPSPSSPSPVTWGPPPLPSGAPQLQHDKQRPSSQKQGRAGLAPALSPQRGPAASLGLSPGPDRAAGRKRGGQGAVPLPHSGGDWQGPAWEYVHTRHGARVPLGGYVQHSCLGPWTLGIWSLPQPPVPKLDMGGLGRWHCHPGMDSAPGGHCTGQILAQAPSPPPDLHPQPQGQREAPGRRWCPWPWSQHLSLDDKLRHRDGGDGTAP